jgi:hypothetical protein
MSAVYGLFASPELAQQAVDGLRAAGIPERDIAIQSSEPFEEYEFGARDRETPMSGIAVLGGAIGLTAAYLLTSITQRAWPINTGGMPIVTNWTNLIILFEMTMLGAVLATVLTLLVSARIPARLPKFYDPRISDGLILIGVNQTLDTSRMESVERALQASSVGVQKTDV